MWGQAEWMDTGDTVDGRRVHNRVDHPNKPLPSPETLPMDKSKIVSRSLTLSSERLGIISKIDVAEVDSGSVIPIDYKRGKRPHVERGAYDPERVQVCLQALLLEEHGYKVKEAAIWYAQSRERVRIELDDELRATAQYAIKQLRAAIANSRIPPPLNDSPKCPRCALVSICLPDEVHLLGGANLSPRPIAVGVDDALPLIVQSHCARILKSGDTLEIFEDGEKVTTVRIGEISDLALFGPVSITTPAIGTLLERDIPVTFHSYGGWFRGVAHGTGGRNVEIRTAQYKHSFDHNSCLNFSRNLIAAKIANQRTIIRRNWRGDKDSRKIILDRLKFSRKSTRLATSNDRLLGIEGDAAATYFRAFATLVVPSHPGKPLVNDRNSSSSISFQFRNRNRRPATDPVNAMLSLAYAMLTRHFTVALSSVGLDPFRGFFHASGYGKPALALDLMEPFRPVISDSVVLSAINTGEVSLDDFMTASTGISLTSAGRRRFIGAFERRLSQEATHPIFGYKVSMRRLILIQVRLLCRYLLGELPAYPHYLPR